jgi:NAD(P)H dehydrogenase (quinone)
MARIAVIYYSATGHVHRLAHAVGEGAQAEGADVRKTDATIGAP